MDDLRQLIKIDAEQEVERIIKNMRTITKKEFHKRGGVIGISGGIDSSVCLGLAVKAFGAKRVFSIAMPEEDSNPESEKLARELAQIYGVEFIVEDLTAAVAGFGTYARRDEAIKNVFPEFDPATHKAKIVLPDNLMDKETLNVFYLTIIAENGEEKTERIPVKEYLQIVAASNFKQRSRMSMLYYHADRLNYIVVGTGNKNEHEQGFFVKYGDGGADIKAIAHLYKTQVYQLAEYLGVSQDIIKRTPTTDTYTAECTQEEFFYRIPFDVQDMIWYAMENNFPVEAVAEQLNLTVDQVSNIQNDLKRKINYAHYLKSEPKHLD